MERMTAAHRTLPFGSGVTVRNLDNGKTVEVRITDRGPFIDGRIIDLSRAAARAIDMIGPGTARVRLRVDRPGPAAPAEGTFAVQLGAFRQRANAEQLRRRLPPRYADARLAREGDLWQVLVGRESTLSSAQELARILRPLTGEAVVVRLDGPDR